MNIVFFDSTPEERLYIEEHLLGHHIIFCDKPLNEETATLAANADIVSVFVYSALTSKTLSQCASLKLIATRSTGFDHIDIAYCTAHHITVCNVPFYGENTVAEHTFALILSLSRNIHRSYMRTQRNDFSIDGLCGFDLKGKTLGVIGAGHIGLHVIRMARGFGMEVLAYDHHANTFLEEVLDFRYVSLEEALEYADIVTLHVPYNEHTHHLINKERIALMKDKAIIINTARGAVIDTQALLEGLQSGKLGGAGLDVLEGEEFIREEKRLLCDDACKDHMAELLRDHVLMHMNNVVYTPHIAFYSKEALERILATSCQNILSFIMATPQNVVLSER